MALTVSRIVPFLEIRSTGAELDLTLKLIEEDTFIPKSDNNMTSNNKMKKEGQGGSD